jgi:hypothetical protein
MKRSERLAREGKIEVYIGSYEIAKVITDKEMSAQAQKLRYICTDFGALYDGREVSANVYENEQTDELFATIENYGQW